jgi:flavin-dependent dehydrogenase
MRPGRALVVGGGPAGSAAAIALARAGVETVLFEAPGPGNKPNETLFPAAKALLDAIGAAGIETQPLRAAFIALNDVARVDIRCEGLAAVVDRVRLDERLRHLAVEAGTTVVRTRAEAVECTAEGAAVVAAGQRFEGACVVDASGKNPVTVRRESEPASGPLLDERFSAFSHFERERGIGVDCCTIAALDRGFAYLLPIRPGRTCVGVTLYDPPELAGAEALYQAALASSSFVTALIEGGRRVLPVIVPRNRASSNPPVSGPRLFRAGDALGFSDPFLWDGISFALRTGARAGELCAELCITGSADPAGLQAETAGIAAEARRSIARQCEGAMSLFGREMAVDPHVSPLVLASLFALTGHSSFSAWRDLRRELSGLRPAA